MRERLIQLLSRYFDIGDSYTYNLTRVKSAFDVGTVDLDDFEEYTEDDVANLADYLLDNGVIVPPVKVGQTVWWCSRFNGIFKYTIARIVVSDGKMCYYDNYNSVWHDSDIGKHLFLTREAAEEALKAREKNA